VKKNFGKNVETLNLRACAFDSKLMRERKEGKKLEDRGWKNVCLQLSSMKNEN
jgi:hypothetical protein